MANVIPIRTAEVEGRVPPSDLDAEGAVISAVLVDPSALDKVNEFLKPEHFYSEAHRRIFEACVELSSTGRPVDVVQVATWLRDRERLAQVGGMAYLTEVLNTAPAVANVNAYADTVVAKWRARQAILIGQQLTSQGYAGADPDTLVPSVIAELSRLGQSSGSRIELLDGPALAAPLPEIDYLVREIGLVGGGGAPDIVAGSGFTGKTMAEQAMALSLAAGRPVWGVYTSRPRRVVHVDLEQGDRLTRRRYQRLARAMGVDLAELGDALAVAIMPPGLTLTPGCTGRWRELMTGRDLVIIDSMRAATGGQDENSSDIRAGLDMLGQLSEQTGCRPLVIHHARKPNDETPSGQHSIRGSSAIFDAVDTAYIFTASKGEPIRVEHLKSRTHGDLVDDLALVISDVELDGDPRAGLVVQVHGAELVTQKREERASAGRQEQARRDAETVQKAIAATPGIGTRALRGVTRLSGDRLAVALTTLGRDIDVRDPGPGRGRSVEHYVRGTR